MVNDEANISKSSEDSSQYRIRPDLADSFKVAAVKDIVNEVMHEKLEGKSLIEHIGL